MAATSKIAQFCPFLSLFIDSLAGQVTTDVQKHPQATVAVLGHQQHPSRLIDKLPLIRSFLKIAIYHLGLPYH